MKQLLTIFVWIGFAFISPLFAQPLPVIQQESKPGTRWWWLGSAVDTTNLRWNMQQYARHGIGALEITPIYGVQGNDRNNISYLSPQWMDMLRFCEEEGKKDGIEIDMATGTGWPFGGPWVPIDEAACKAVWVDTIVIAKKIDVSKIHLVIPEKERPYAKLQSIRVFPTSVKRH